MDIGRSTDRQYRRGGVRARSHLEPRRIKRATVYLALLAACSAAARPLGVFPWHLSGNDFVAQVSGQAQRPDAAYQQRYAEGYQAGVVDATQGRLWCAPQGMKPTEVDDRIWGELRKKAGSMTGSAADELVRLYAARFPCSGRELDMLHIPFRSFPTHPCSENRRGIVARRC